MIARALLAARHCRDKCDSLDRKEKAVREKLEGGSLLGMGIVVIAGLLALNWKQMRRPPDVANDNTPD